jgi:phosphatidylinositol alpha-1,6-mannosyltransferase
MSDAVPISSDGHRRRRVLALVSDAFGGYGGIAQYNRDLIAALAACPQIESILVIPRTGMVSESKLPPNVRQLNPPRGRVGYIGEVLQQVSKKAAFDLLFCGHVHLAWLAQMAALRIRVPYWLQLHGIEAWEEPGGHVRRAVETANLVTSVSRHTRQRVLAWADIPPERLRVLPNTVRAEFRSGTGPAEGEQCVLRRYGLEGRDVILTVARIDASDSYKGHDKVIRAMKNVISRHPEAIYVIVGRGGNRDSLERIAANAGVTERVRFLGCLSDDETRELYRVARMFVMPSNGEGFGIVFLEAAASGLPVIAGNRDGSIDALAEGALGTLIDPEDQGALIVAICDVLGRPRKTAVPEALARFDVPNFNAQVMRLVESIH